MLRYLLFTDISLSPQKKHSVGGYLFIEAHELSAWESLEPQQISAILYPRIEWRVFQNNKSTFAEITTMIYAVEQCLEKNPQQITIYTDCQSLVDLLDSRLAKLSAAEYRTRSGKILANAEVYKDLLALTKKIDLVAIKIKGHASQSQRTTIEAKIFAILDAAVRKRLRLDLENLDL